MVAERALRFGRENHLVGVLTLPPAGVKTTATAAILVNAGLIYRIGPHRLHVRIARELAAQGVACLRLDLSGIGDSGTVAQPGETPEVQDVIDAMDQLGELGIATRFALFGICAGAVRSYHAALKDARVSGVIMVDGYLYRTWKTPILYYWRRASSGLSVIGALGRKLKWLFGARRPPERAAVQLAIDTGTIEASSFVEGLRQLSGRNAWAMQIVTGSFPEIYNYAGQFSDRFGGQRLGPLVTSEYLPWVDHTFMQRRDQDHLTAMIARRIQGA